MKTKLTLFALALLSLSLYSVHNVHGQAGIANGQRYINHKDDYVDFGNFAINKGVVSSSTATTSVTGHVTVAISSADILALYSAPKLLVTTPGAGHSIAILKVIFAITRTSSVYTTGGGAAIIQYNSTVHGGGTQACDSTIAATVITGSAGLSNTIRNGAVISDSSATDNQGIYLSAATGDFTAGTGTAVADVYYVVN